MTSESAISSTWKESTWGKEVSINYGKSLRDYDTNTGDFQVFGTNGPIGWCDHFLVDGPGIILGRKGATRGVFFSERPFYVIDTAYYVTPNSKMNLRWLYFAIIYHRLAKIDDGSPIPSTPRSAIRNIPLLVPPVETQEKIGNCLTNYDHLSLSNQNIANITQKIISTLFRSWFIDFEPVKAKSEGKLPYGMDEETAALFPDSFEDSEFGQLPKGWNWGTLLDISDIWTGGTPKTSESSYWSGDIPWVSGADLSSDELFAIDSSRKITSLGVEKSSTKILPVGTVMITARGTVGATKITAVPMAMSQTSFGFKAKEGISDALIYQASQETIRQLRSFAYGAVFDTFTQSTIDITNIAIAPLKILQAFGKIVDPLFEQLKNSAKTEIDLATTRDALLPRLMSGELSVS